MALRAKKPETGLASASDAPIMPAPHTNPRSMTERMSKMSGPSSTMASATPSSTPADVTPFKAPVAAASYVPSREALHSNGPHAKLVIHRGRSVGKEFLLNEDEAHIGRWDADGGIFPDVDLDADDPEAKVSRRHARIVRRNEQYFIEDLGSTNGTFINRGRRLLPGDRQQLHDGDEVIVGKTFLRFQVVK